MLKTLSFIAEYWFLIIWAVGILFGYLMGGWRYALAVATLGAGIFLYKSGEKKGREIYEEAANDIQERRENAYQEITDRNTSGNDVVDRLRKADY